MKLSIVSDEMSSRKPDFAGLNAKAIGITEATRFLVMKYSAEAATRKLNMVSVPVAGKPPPVNGLPCSSYDIISAPAPRSTRA